MSYRTLFSDAVGRIPPTSIDVERVITRQRRVVRLRRLGVVAAAAVTVGAMTFAVAGGTGRPRAEMPAGPSPSVPAPSPGRTFTTTDTTVLAAVERVAPDLEWVPPSAGGPSWTSGASTPHNVPNSYLGQGRVRSGGRTGELVVHMDSEFGPLRPCTATSAERFTCAQTSGPGGRRIQTSSVRDQAGRSVSRLVHVAQPGNGVLIVSIRGEDEHPPLTVAQLTAVALDPAVAEVAADPLRFDGDVRRMLIDREVLEVVRREAPKVRGLGGDGSVNSPIDLEDSWGDRINKSTADHYTGQGGIMMGKASGRLVVEISRRPPRPSADLACKDFSRSDPCETGTGPRGEKYWTISSKWRLVVRRQVYLLRRDGSWLEVDHIANSPGKLVLTSAQQLAVALDPKVALGS